MKDNTSPCLIETDFPLRKVSEESVREKNIRHGHISTLHIWWARKPLSASRTTALAALLPDDPNRRQEFLRLIEDLAPREAVQGENPNLKKARALIREAFGGRVPRVLDPFAGGGAIPLELLRLGCETYALDYNPVAVLLTKAVLEYPQKYGRPGSVAKVPLPPGDRGANKELFPGSDPGDGDSPLLKAVRAWGRWVLEEARKELKRFYLTDPDGSIPVGYYWMRTVPCQNQACGVEIPLTANWWLAKKDNKKVALRMILNRLAKQVDFEVVGQHGESLDFDPAEGTVARAKVRCPLCGGTLDANTTRRLFREGKAGQRMVAVVLHHPGRTGKTYRLPTERDLEAYRAAEEALEQKRQALWAEWGMDPVPDEALPPKETLGFRVQRYGLTRWGDLFNARQKLALITFAEKVRRAYAEMLEKGEEEGFAKAVGMYLGLTLDRLADYNSMLCHWHISRELIGNTLTRQALPMVWDYPEINPFSSSTGGWSGAVEWVASFIAHASSIVQSGSAFCGSATSLLWPDNHFDVVFTDPPYYDNVPYSYLSDFFYVWLKRTIGDLYSDLFTTPLTPKSQDMVAYLNGGTIGDAKRRFEEMLTEAFREIHRVLKPEGIAVIVFAHKTTAAWETVIQALLDAGLYMIASWPIHTEMQARLRAQESAALASSIYMVCRKRTVEEIGEYARVRREIGERIRRKLAQFWDEGIQGADFFMSAIGPAVEVFGRYTRVEKLSGEPVKVRELLEHVRQVVAEFALERILAAGARLGGVDALTRFYLLWRWTYNHARVPFDEARKLASGVGVEITEQWDAGGLVEKQKEYIKVRSAQEWAKDRRFAQQERFTIMVDALHRALVLWEQNRTRELQEHLASTYGNNEAFWQVAQAISEVLPDGDREKQSLQGLLYRRRTYDMQMRMFEPENS